MTKILFFDIKSADLNCHISKKKKTLISQLSFNLFDTNQNLIESGNYHIKPNSASLIKALGKFFCTAIKTDYFISHNLKFNFDILNTEAVKVGFGKQYNDLFQYRNSLNLNLEKSINNLEECSDYFFRLYKKGEIKIKEYNFDSICA